MKRDKLYFTILTTLVLLFSVSCEKCPKKVEPDEKLYERTILAYLAGDHNLYHEVPKIHAALEKGWDNSEIDGALLVFADMRGQDKPMLIRIEKRRGVTISDTLINYTTENSADPELFSKVIADVKAIAPAKSYGLLLFSHASGWLPEGAFRNPIKWEANNTKAIPAPRSIFEDKGREMELSDFVNAVPDGTFDFIASEMCFMSGVEIAYALRNKTKYILASVPVVVSPGFTEVYKTSLAMLYKREPDLKGFGQKYFDYFNNNQNENFKSAAISLVKTSEMQALADFTRKIAPKLTQEQIDMVQYYERKSPHLFFDYRDYIEQVATPQQMSELDDLLAKAVLFKRNTPMVYDEGGVSRIRIAKHSGLSVYIPQDRLPNLNKAYEDTDWYKATN